ncbi:MAG: ribosome small subunit-dependent GTPase A [Chloroflexota bacterium]
MTLEALGYNSRLEKYKKENGLDDYEIGRIAAEHKERYIVRSAAGEREAEITGNMRFSASGREDYPAVGDWVAFMPYDDDFAIIHKILPRSSVIERQAVGQFGEVQIIAANIDYAFLVQAVDRDFNVNRLERYLAICYSSKVKPIIILSKIDLIDHAILSELIDKVKARHGEVPIIPISSEDPASISAVESIIERGKTYCLLGSSGVGKSTLMNNLSGKSVMKTDEISKSTNKGRHVTSHRELIVLENGGIIIDNPGMREVGVSDSGEGLEAVFDSIAELAHNCRFVDCTHTSEAGCAVLESLGKGELDEEAYENYIKLERERAYFETSVAERRKRDKAFGKILKNYKKDMKRNS